MSDFDPGDVGKKGSLFGFPYQQKEADLVVIPIPWDVTVSYGEGTSLGPTAILEASTQLDFSIPRVVDPWAYKSVMLAPDKGLKSLNDQTRVVAKRVIDSLESGKKPSERDIKMVNDASEKMIKVGFEMATEVIRQGRKVAFVGGDHSTPLGLMQALAEVHEFGILQIDAHMDLRDSYEGFKYSHASIMFNALKLSNVLSLTQVGIRDFAPEETDLTESSKKRINVFYDEEIHRALYNGERWSSIVSAILKTLPPKVYISFDIDGLEPANCPNTGTPVPGGLSYNQAINLLQELALSGKEIIGFDLSEVGPGDDEWDGSVGARVLYRLISSTGISSGAIKYS